MKTCNTTCLCGGGILTARGALANCFMLIQCSLIVFVLAASTETPVQSPAAFCIPKKPGCFWAQPNALEELTRLLNTSPADVLAARDSKHHSALNTAAYNLHVEGVRALISAGADIHNVDKNNHQPLHHAVLSPLAAAHGNAQLQVIRILLAAGANVSAVDKTVRQATPLEIALSKIPDSPSKRDVVSELQEAIKRTGRSLRRGEVLDPGTAPEPRRAKGKRRRWKRSDSRS